ERGDSQRRPDWRVTRDMSTTNTWPSNVVPMRPRAGQPRPPFPRPVDITAPVAPAARRAAPGLRALRHRNFRLYLWGQGVSSAGTWLQWVAQAWLVYRLGGSPLALGLLVCAAQAPALLL